MISTKKRLVVLGIAGLVIAMLIAVGLALYFTLKSEEIAEAIEYTGGVVTNGHECAAIGSAALTQGGSAMDAAIAALFCEGVAMPQSMGLGGGFLMTIYIKETNTIRSLNARETAPIAATENMFNGNSTIASKGGLSVAVPGELSGYWEAHQTYGKLKWADLIQPTIDLCIKGHLVTPYLANLFKKQEASFLKNPSLREVFIDPKTNQSYGEGHLLKRLKLAETLKIIARDGASALYNGALTKPFVDDIKSLGGIITEEDMDEYRPEWQTPIKASLFNKYTLYTSPLPGSGVILTFVLNVLNGYLDFSTGTFDTVTNWQKITETFKYGYAKRTELGDADFVPGIQKLLKKLTSPAYAAIIRKKITEDTTFNDPAHYGANVTVPEDHGTAHISVLAPNGDAVSVTSTINLYFGASIRSVSTGIILNDEMDDFSSPNMNNDYGLPPSPSNYIRPHKRPLSSMCPSIIIDEHGEVVLVIGAAGGSKITTSVALVTLRTLWAQEDIKAAVWASRLHHQLFPMKIDIEHDFNPEVISALGHIGHNISVAAATDGFAALTALTKINGVVEGSTDKRRGGQVALVP